MVGDDHGSGPSSRTPPSGGRRVLVVDDDALLRRALGRMLRGHEVVPAASISEAFGILEEDRAFDLILCDLMMPDGLGSELYGWAVGRWPETASAFRFMTGGVFLSELVAFAKKHEDLILAKPFRRSELKALLAGLAGGSD